MTYHYYGLINGNYGFLSEDDKRVTSEMVKLTENQWQALLEGQSKGEEIISCGGKAFLAEPGRYYIDNNKQWKKRTDKEYEQYLAELERERIDGLVMTPAEFIKALRKNGYTAQKVNALLENNLEIKLLFAGGQEISCGQMREFCPIKSEGVELGADDIDKMFIEK